ncbi:MAG: nitrogenase component 1 [Lachnospiraceae bacterium]|nr:nitrogenase component 1 [Lachnospiraceae bacterium]
MGLNGMEMLSKMKHLSEVNNMKQVKPSSYALFPGYHCPLMGAMLTIKEIDNSVMVVVGPDECAYYTQLATSGGTMKTNGCQIVSVVLDQHDITFGCQEKMDEAFEELMDEYKPEAVYIVTTCVVEVTGDDVDSMAAGYQLKYGLPVMVVHAENFKTDDHLPGIEHTLDASINLMKEQTVTDSVNVLGLRLGSFMKTEVCRYLNENGVKIGLMLPGKASAKNIEEAPAAKCNIVVHPVGLPLAKAMKERFGTPYVLFERYSDPERIMRCYSEVFSILGKKIPDVFEEKQQEQMKKIENIRNILGGKTYISGNTALCNYELHSFLVNRLDAKPLLLQISDLDEDSLEFRKEILSKCDPYVTRAANIGALGYLYPHLLPDFNIGAGNSMEMRKYGIVSVRMLMAYNTLGFEVCDMILDAFVKADEEAKMSNGGKHHGIM